MMYGTNCWPIKKNQTRKLVTAEMRMLRWMCGRTRLDRIRNEKKKRVSPRKKNRVSHGGGEKGKGRLRLTWEEQISWDFAELHLSEDMIYDRSQWRRRIKMQDT
ncbi:hypothetical protein E3N88_41617 [Mikania micrantha]|uniref:Uncharacterized protein n=1 Tax=Mikania micrantha TaxID=192012 RepID=A0A5N6LK57_9ASTR|nr:hypothetical protein E3N88_41617 [Mikania micrantha]